MYKGVAKHLTFVKNRDKAFISYVMPTLKPLKCEDEEILYS